MHRSAPFRRFVKMFTMLSLQVMHLKGEINRLKEKLRLEEKSAAAAQLQMRQLYSKIDALQDASGKTKQVIGRFPRQRFDAQVLAHSLSWTIVVGDPRLAHLSFGRSLPAIHKPKSKRRRYFHLRRVRLVLWRGVSEGFFMIQVSPRGATGNFETVMNNGPLKKTTFAGKAAQSVSPGREVAAQEAAAPKSTGLAPAAM